MAEEEERESPGIVQRLVQAGGAARWLWVALGGGGGVLIVIAAILVIAGIAIFAAFAIGGLGGRTIPQPLNIADADDEDLLNRFATFAQLSGEERRALLARKDEFFALLDERLRLINEAKTISPEQKREALRHIEQIKQIVETLSSSPEIRREQARALEDAVLAHLALPPPLSYSPARFRKWIAEGRLIFTGEEEEKGFPTGKIERLVKWRHHQPNPVPINPKIHGLIEAILEKSPFDGMQLLLVGNHRRCVGEPVPQNPRAEPCDERGKKESCHWRGNGGDISALRRRGSDRFQSDRAAFQELERWVKENPRLIGDFFPDNFKFEPEGFKGATGDHIHFQFTKDCREAKRKAGVR